MPDSIALIKAVLLILCIAAVSMKDIKDRQIPDHCHLMIAMIGLINFSPIHSFLGLLIALPFLVVAIISPVNAIGGADIKFVGSIGFVLGLSNGFIATIIGLVSFVIFSLCKDKNKPYPMLPFLSFGVLSTLILLLIKEG